MSGRLLLILHTHLPYVIRHGRWPHGVEWLCEAAAGCYIPLLRELNRLAEEGFRQVLTLSFSPVLLEQLADDEFAGIFAGYLRERIESAEADEREFSRENRPDLARAARYWAEWYSSIAGDFDGRFDRDLVAAFRMLGDADVVSLQTCGATHGYFPLLGDDRSVHAQVQVAVQTHSRHFHRAPRGIWMPECAYRPAGYWEPPIPGSGLSPSVRLGIESLIAAGGLEYTVVDAHTVRAGRPVDWYGHLRGSAAPRNPVPLEDPRSLYRNYTVSGQSWSPVSVFPRDVETALHVWSAEIGYPGSGPYLEFHKKYHRSGGRYWRVTGREVDLAGKGVYDPEGAAAQVARDAAEFAGLLGERMHAFRESTGSEGTVCLPFDTELFGHWWHEGPTFLGHLVRRLAETTGVVPTTAAAELDRRGPGLPVAMPEGSWGEGGDHRVWLNKETAWTWPELWRAEKEYISLVESRRPENRLEERALRQMGRELMIAQASDWQFLITNGSAADYATDRFREHIRSVDTIGAYIASLRRGVERYDLFDELCRLEARDRLFPDLDVDYWLWKRGETSVATFDG